MKTAAKKKPRVSKTKLGTEYRVRGKDGKLHGEFDSKASAKSRKKKVVAGRKGGKKSS